PTYGIPYNAETQAAFAETEEMIRKIKAGEYVPRYSSFKDILAEIDAEIAAEDGGLFYEGS
ncbi:MAG: hypothetical protein LBE35_10775, partial [Clostridiales bacterium]|nr:hypothetical protein [Clostridiales bacterium]